MRLPGVTRAREAVRVRRRERGLRLGRPADVAAALARAITDLAVPGATAASDAPRLLVLPKVGGTEDIIAALSGRGRIGLKLAALPRSEVKAVHRALIGPDHVLLTDLDYRPHDAALDVVKARSRAFLRPVVETLREELGLAGIVGANVAYYAERELAGACEDVGLPFLVLHKESMRSPRQREWFTRAYHERIGPFSGRAVAVYNRDERDSQVAGGIVADATVVGAPRIDVLHAARHARPGPPADGPLVLFAIDPGAGAWTPLDGELATGAPRWDGLARATEDAFLATARDHPARTFVIKAKVGHGARLLARLPAGLPANVSVVTDGTATALLLEAAAVVAFNSTVVGEALAAGVPIVVPAFAEASEPDAAGWFLPVGDAVRRVSDPATLGTVLLDAAASASVGAALPAASEAVLDRLVGNGDGRAADRTWGWLCRELDIA